MKSPSLPTPSTGRSHPCVGVWPGIAGMACVLLFCGSSAFSADIFARASNAVSGRTLYEKHCAGCHGPDGAGDGPGVRYVYPLPRNLRRDRYNIVSNRSRIASREDMTQVLRDGMPGTAMKPFRDVLERAELTALVDEVVRMRREGARDAYLEHCQLTGDTPDETECGTLIEQKTSPAATLVPPEFGPGGRAAVARGRQLFRQQGCPSCHGQEGQGTADLTLMDQSGSSLRARDLVHEPFKGGHDDVAVYYRIRFGFPGGPMPEHPALTEAEVVDLVAYVQSLAREPKRVLRTYEMRRYATRGLYMSELGGSKKTEP